MWTCLRSCRSRTSSHASSPSPPLSCIRSVLTAQFRLCPTTNLLHSLSVTLYAFCPFRDTVVLTDLVCLFNHLEPNWFNSSECNLFTGTRMHNSGHLFNYSTLSALEMMKAEWFGKGDCMWVCRLVKFSSWGTFKNLTCEKDQSNGFTVVICSMLNIVFAWRLVLVSCFIIIISHLPTAQLQHQLWGPKCIRHRHRQIHWAGHRSL